MNFRYRLAFFLIVTLVLVQGLSALFAYVYLRQTVVEQGKQELADATAAFSRQLDVLSERATEGVEVLSLDFALRQAIARQDRGTELSALRNHGHRIGATRMMLVGLDGKIAADTLRPQDEGQTFAFHNQLNTALQNGESARLAVVGKQPCLLVVVPVRAPVPIAFIAACIPVDAAFLQKVREISSTARSIALVVQQPDRKWAVAAESGTHKIALNGVSRISPAQNATEIVSDDNRDYLVATAQLPTAEGGVPLAVVLDYPLDKALSPYRSLIAPVLIVLLIALFIAVAGAMLIVRGFSKPLEALAASARRIAGGDYSIPKRIKERDELGQLSDALINMTHSISEREAALTRAIETAEQARNEAVRANEAKSQFLANMSHELRTPLNAVLGFSEMLMHQVFGPLGAPNYAEYARDIHSSGEHLLGLVQRMLDLAEADAGRLELARGPLDLNQAVQELLRPLCDFARKAKVGLEYAAPPGAWPQINGVANKIKQAFTNIIHNAIKFTPAGGKVAISGHTRADRIELRIEDNGIGMRPEDVNLVIRPFHRLRSALDGEHQGAGLGLPFAKAVIERHGGLLSIESTPGIGTTVTIALPVAEGALEAAA